MRIALKIDARIINHDLILIQKDMPFSYSYIALWSLLFRESKVSTKNEPPSGRPSATTKKSNIKPLEELDKEDRPMSLRATKACLLYTSRRG